MPGNRFVCLLLPYRKEAWGFIVKHSERRRCQKQIYQPPCERRPVVLARFARGLDTLPLFKTADQRYPLEGFSKGPVPAWIYSNKLLVPLFGVFPSTAGRRWKLRAGQRMGENSPLALAGVENKGLVVLGLDCELVLRRVEDVEQKVTLPGAAQDTRTHISTRPFGQSCKVGAKRAHLPCSHTCT